MVARYDNAVINAARTMLKQSQAHHTGIIAASQRGARTLAGKVASLIEWLGTEHGALSLQKWDPECGEEYWTSTV